MVEIFLFVCRVIAIEKHAGSTYFFFFLLTAFMLPRYLHSLFIQGTAHCLFRY